MKPKPIEVSPSRGGQLISALSANEAGIFNYTEAGLATNAGWDDYRITKGAMIITL